MNLTKKQKKLLALLDRTGLLKSYSANYKTKYATPCGREIDGDMLERLMARGGYYLSPVGDGFFEDSQTYRIVKG